MYFFLGQLAHKYAFCISHATILRSFKAASVSVIRTESREMKNEYVIEAGVPILCPPATNLVFLLKYSPSFIFQTA